MAGNDVAASIQACAMRVSRLATDGSTPAGATNMIVTDQLTKLDLKVVEEDGEEFTVKNACGAIAYSYKDADRLKRLDGDLTTTNPDPELAEMITAGSLITSGGMTIGYSAPAIGAAAPVGVCLELWSKAWVGGGAPQAASFTDGATTNASPTLTSATAGFTASDVGRSVSGTGIPGGTTILSVTNATTVTMSANASATATGLTITMNRPGPYWRWVFPKYVGSLSDFSLENAPKEQAFNGPFYENPNIGNGPANDFPSGFTTAGRVFSYFRDTALPTVAKGYQATPSQV